MNIVYTGLFAYPDSSANSLRVEGVVRILEDLGHTVTICSGLASSLENVVVEQPVTNVNEYESGVFSKVKGVRGMFVGDNTIAWLESLQEKPDVIILYGTHLGYLTRLLNFTKKNKIKLILDVVEWYDPRHLPGGILGPFAIMNELSMRFFVKKADGLIVISQYLKNYYSEHTNKIVLIPPVFEENYKRILTRTHAEFPAFCYVGTPGKKENFNVLFKVLDMFYVSKVKFKVNFAGMKRIDFVNKYKDVKFIKDEEYSQFYGRVPNDKAKDIIASSDFMLVFRPNLRFANAGFPSKIAESLSLGTAVFCNNFSDVSDYVFNGHNGVVINDMSFSDLTREFKKIFSYSNAEYNKMRQNSYDSYRLSFHKTAYMERMETFLQEVC